ncbi:MAG: hypothetical protein AAB223_00530, partial [Pseudomonadota bacterium]
EITEAEVRAMLGLADRTLTFDLVEAALAGDGARALGVLALQHDAGAEAAQTIEDALGLVHWLTRIKLVPEAADDLAVPELERNRGRTMADALAIPALARAWQILLKGLAETRAAPNGAEAAAMVLVRLAYASSLPTPEEAIRALAQGAPPLPASPPLPEARAPAAPAPAAQSRPPGAHAPKTYDPAADRTPGNLSGRHAPPGAHAPKTYDPAADQAPGNLSGRHAPPGAPRSSAALAQAAPKAEQPIAPGAPLAEPSGAPKFKDPAANPAPGFSVPPLGGPMKESPASPAGRPSCEGMPNGMTPPGAHAPKTYDPAADQAPGNLSGRHAPPGALAMESAIPAAEATPPALETFAEVVALAGARKEGRLASHLARDVHLVRFEPGRIEFRAGEHAPDDLAQQLSRFLQRETARTWLVGVSAAAGQRTLAEEQAAARASLRAELAEHPFVKAVQAAFPEARLDEVRAPRREAAEPPADEAGLNEEPDRE